MPCSLRAGAWTQNPGHGQIILTTSFFQTSDTFDASGDTQKFGDHGRFRQFLIDSYTEDGLTPRSTLVLHVPAPFLDYSNIYGARHSAGLGDVEIGLKRRLNSAESPWALSGQLTVAAPAYSELRNPAPGNHQEDIEARFLMGHGTDWRPASFLLGCRGRISLPFRCAGRPVPRRPDRGRRFDTPSHGHGAGFRCPGPTQWRGP